MGTTIIFRRGENDPTSGSGLTLAEPAFNTNLHTFHIGLGHGVTAEWVGAPISGLSADIAAGITYKTPTASAVRNYIAGLCFGNTAGGGGGAVSSVSGSGNGVLVSPTTGAVVVSNTGVHSFNGLTGAVQGVSAAVAGDGIAVSGATGAVTITNTGVTRAVAGTGISVSGATGSVTITNIGVQSFNGNTGAVTGASLGANTFTALNTFNAGITTEFIYASTGSTFAGTLQVNGGATFAATANFTNGLTSAGDIRFSGTATKNIRSSQAPIVITGITSAGVFTSYNSITLPVTNAALSLGSASGLVNIVNNATSAVIPGLRILTDDTGEGFIGSFGTVIKPGTYASAERTQTLQDASGTLALTSQLMGAVNGSTAETTAVTSFNGLTGAVGGVCAAQANTFTALQTFTAGISAAGGMTLDGGKVWHSLNDGPTSGLDAGQLYGVTASLYASSLSTGLLYGGLVTINAGNSAAFDVSAGAGYIVTTGATFTAEPTPVITRVAWTAKTGVTLSGLTAQDTTWIYFDSSGNLQQQAAFFTDDQVQSSIAVGALVHPSRAYISLAKTIPNVSYATDKQYEQFIRAFGPLKVSGHTIQANGANLKLNRTSGTAFILGRNYPNDPNNPSVISDNAQTDCTFWRYYRGATAGSFVTVLDQTAIDPENYDDGTGTLNTVPSNKPFTIQRLFFFPGTPSVLGVYYGRGIYASMAEAANNVTFEDFTEITNTATNAVFAGYLLVKKGTTDLTTAIAADDARIIQSGQFRSTTSGGGAVSTNLDSLNDVIISSVQDDDVLIYDTATSQWLNTPLQHIGVTRVNGLSGAVQAVSSFNGLTGAVQGVSAAVAGTGISVSGATGAVTITNIGVQSFNGNTGAVTGASLGANTFTGLNTFNAGISASGATFSSLVRSSGGFSGDVNISSTNASGNMYPVLSRGAGVTALFVDSVTTPLVYQPLLGNLGLKGITLADGNDYLYITPQQITATNTSAPNSAYFYFVSPEIYFQAGNTAGLVAEGDTRQLVWGDLLNSTDNCYFGVNRDATTMEADYAVEINHSTGKALQLIYNTYGGTASDSVKMDVTSGGDLVITPSGGDATVSGRLFANNIVNALNGFTGGITLAAGTGITFTASGGTITLASTVTGGSGGSTNSTTQTLDFSSTIDQIEFVLYGSGGDYGTSLRYIENNETLNITVYTTTGPVSGYAGVLESVESFYDSTNGWSARIVIKPPFTDGESAETIISETLSSVYIDIINGTTILTDFWENIQGVTVLHKEATHVTKTVTGQTWVTAGSYIECKVLGLTTADHTPEDAILEGVRFEIDNIVAGTGFDIIGHAPEGTYGKYSVKCLGQ